MPHQKSRPQKLATLSAAGLLLVACASTPPAPPPFNPAQSAAEQADSFIAGNETKYTKGINKVAITACNVMFAETSGASASTSPGLFGNTNRAESKVTVLYTMVGLSDADMQKITDRVCHNAEEKLKSQGFELATLDEMQKNSTFMELQKSGKASPFIYNSGQTKYKVFTRTGESIFDPRYIGMVSGLGQAFKAASGKSSVQYEAQIMDQLKASAININVLIDFAALQSDGSKSLGGLADKNTANVTGKVEMSVAGEFRVKTNVDMKCWERLGKRECDNSKQSSYAAYRPVNLEDTFYESIKDTTTVTDSVVSGVTKALSFLAGGQSTDITRYQVDVVPATFETVSDKAINGFMDMALVKLAADKNAE